jgi:histidine triad (HIT) family protein
MSERCILCAIVAGTAPAERVYEDDGVVAVMDINPATIGHVIVFPKSHSSDLWHISTQDGQRVMAASVQVARMIREALGPDGMNLVQATGPAAWQTVFHFHMHLVPRYEGDGLVPPWPLDHRGVDGPGLREVAERIRRAGSTGRPATP